MAKTDNLKDYLTDLYEGIKTKNPNASRNPQNFRADIESIETGIDTSDATATANDILLGKTAYVNGVKVDGTIETYDYSFDEGGNSVDTARIVTTTTELVEGTPIPNDNTSVSGIYLFHHIEYPAISSTNAKKYIEEANLTFVNIGDYEVYVALVDIKTYNAYGIVRIFEGNNYNYVFVRANLLNLDEFEEYGSTYGADFWHLIAEEINYYIEFPTPITTINNIQGIAVGNENDKIKNLVSFTPFQQEVVTPKTILMGDYESRHMVIYENIQVDLMPYIENKQIITSIYIDVPPVEVIPEGYLKPSGTKYIETNGFHDVDSYSEVSVNVPIPSDYIKPSGTLTIYSNGIYDVKNFEEVNINISSDNDLLEQLNNDTLSSYSNSNITSVRAYLFNANEALKSVDLPNVTSIETYAFYTCRGLTSVKIPNCLSIKIRAFAGCSRLISLRLESVTSIANHAFYNVSNLKNIYLGAKQVVSLGGTNNFATGLKVHVRPEYADQYATATNWSSMIESGKITIIGDYTDE